MNAQQKAAALLMWKSMQKVIIVDGNEIEVELTQWLIALGIKPECIDLTIYGVDTNEQLALCDCKAIVEMVLNDE